MHRLSQKRLQRGKTQVSRGSFGLKTFSVSECLGRNLLTGLRIRSSGPRGNKPTRSLHILLLSASSAAREGAEPLLANSLRRRAEIVICVCTSMQVQPRVCVCRYECSRCAKIGFQHCDTCTGGVDNSCVYHQRTCSSEEKHGQSDR